MEPLSLFLYTWRFLSTLEREEENAVIRKAYRYFAAVSAWTVPIFYFSLFIASVISSGYYEKVFVEGNADK